MHEFLVAAMASVLLTTASIFVFYEVLRMAWIAKERISHRPRSLIYFLVVAIFIGHTLAVWIHGAAFWLMAEHWHLGELHHALTQGAPINSVFEYVYFSVTCYSSLGFGDIVATGPLRMVAGIEALTGLLLIGWSVTYTYFATERYLAGHTRR